MSYSISRHNYDRQLFAEGIVECDEFIATIKEEDDEQFLKSTFLSYYTQKLLSRRCRIVKEISGFPDLI